MAFNETSMPVVRAGKAIDDLRLFVDLTLNAIPLARRQADVTQLAALISQKLPETSSFKTDDELANAFPRAEHIRDFANTRMETFLFELASVRFWSIVEACVDELAIECMKTLDRCKNQQLFDSIKGPLLEFARFSEEERADCLLQSLKNKMDAPLKVGVGRFESILDPCGLGGRVHELTRRALLELGQVRNLVVHCGSRVDQRALTQCPWLQYKVGDRLQLTMKNYCLYGTAVHEYLLEIKRRIYVREEIPIPDSLTNDTLVTLLERYS